MQAVGIKQLKARFSEYVRRARQGETILILDREKVVAELIPAGGQRAENVGDAMIAQGIREGWVRPPLRPMRTPPRQFALRSQAEILTILDTAREDRQ